MCIEVNSCNQLSLLHAILNPSLAGLFPCVEDYWPKDQAWQVPNGTAEHMIVPLTCLRRTLVLRSLWRR